MNSSTVCVADKECDVIVQRSGSYSECSSSRCERLDQSCRLHQGWCRHHFTTGVKCTNLFSSMILVSRLMFRQRNIHPDLQGITARSPGIFASMQTPTLCNPGIFFFVPFCCGPVAMVSPAGMILCGFKSLIGQRA